MTGLTCGTDRHKRLYAFLSEQPNRVVQHEHLYAYFDWDRNNLKVAICELRKILRDGETIQNIYGAGYRFLPAQREA